jgi:hypothetical protein
VKHLWNDDWQGRIEVFEENVHQSQFIHRKYHNGCLGHYGKDAAVIT